MIKIKNINTGEEKNVFNVYQLDGAIVSDKIFTQRFFNANGMLTATDTDDEKKSMTLTLAEGWEVIETKGRAKMPNETNGEQSSIKDTTAVDAPVEKPKKKRTPKPAANTAGEVASIDGMKAEMLAKYGTMGADIFEAVCKVAKIQPSTINEHDVEAIFNRMAQSEPAKVREIKRTANNNNNKDYKCSDFDEIADYIAEGQPVYMYGAAGCGKSHTAEQIARELNLDYYTQSQVLFAHDVKGYGDANGTYQDTPFFKAFMNGGLFFIDEMDASAPEALVVLNTAIANRRYDFPIIGCVEAHPNFRIIAAGNTALTGADVEYTARSVQDASTINRFAFFEMQYEKNVELNVMAHGDKELYSFIVDLRHAIKSANVQLCVSYRQTAILASPLATKYGKTKALKRNVFGGRDTDEIRIIHGQLKNTDNDWARAMAELIK